MSDVQFESYRESRFDDCLILFDANCPGFFAENERQDYIEYLETTARDYFVGHIDGRVVAAFGFSADEHSKRGRISWIMVDPTTKGQGVGRQMMQQVSELATHANIKNIDILASHLSAPFFQHFGATTIKFIEHGWGKDMHRVDMELVL